MSRMTWQFPENPSGKKVGFNNQGAAHFTGARFQNVIRETAQNSLDAVADRSRPVRIGIRQEEIKTQDMDTKGLMVHIRAAVRSSKVRNDKPHLQALQKYMQGAIRTGSIPTLIISESNTTGASDIPGDDDETSMWEALTNAEGVDVKAGINSAGSHGIGKNAPYTISIPRTILYSTNYEDPEGNSKSRFIGRTMLVSHEEKGHQYTHEGYLGGDSFNPLEDEAIPPRFKKETPGLDVYIVGFETPEETDWEHLATTAAITNFFHSIIQGKVVFDIAGSIISAETIGEMAVQNQDSLTQETKNFMTASLLEPVDRTAIEGIGDVNLHLKVYEDPEQNQREVAILRDSGMLITDQLPRMNLQGMKREASFSRHLKGFTAIIECLSPDQPSLLKDSESTSHSEIHTDNIVDPSRRRQANRQLGRMAEWVKHTIQERTHREFNNRIGEANELNKFIALEGEADSTPGETVPSGIIQISPPRPVVSGISPYRTRANRGANVIMGNQNGGGGSGGQGGQDRGDGKSTGDRRQNNGNGRGGRNDTSRNQEHPFSKLRMTRNGPENTHSLIATFDNPQTELNNIRLVTVGEDGSDKNVGLRARAKINGKSVTTKNDAIRSIKPPEGTDRIILELYTREPVVRDGMLIKSFDLKLGGDAR